MYLPRPNDFFPQTKRGHGTTHPFPRFDRQSGVQTRKATECVDPTCNRNQTKSTNLHIDQYSNVQDWRQEHGLRKADPLPW